MGWPFLLAAGYKNNPVIIRLVFEKDCGVWDDIIGIMKINLVSSLAQSVGSIWKELQAKSAGPTFNVASPLSSTPVPIYSWIVEHARDFPNWDNVRFVLMDEQVEGTQPPYRYISRDDPASYEGFASRVLLEPLKRNVGVNVPVDKPDLQTIETFKERIDLLVLALGVEGNYANVMPGTQESVGWHIAHLTPAFRQAHTAMGSVSYPGAHFREFGMSLGPQQVLTAENVVVIIRGSGKRDLTLRLLAYEEFDPEFPLSIIFHPAVADQVQIFIAEDVGIAASELGL